MMDKNVSVALATYNGMAYIESQLNSILNQTLSPKEIIIVDDCSQDGTYEFLNEFAKKYPLIRLYRNEKNLGPIETFKNAISLCQYEYIALSDQDDIWFANKIETQLKVIESDITKPLLVFHDLSLIDENGQSVFPSFWELQRFRPQRFTFKKLLSSNIITGCTCLINKAMKDELMRCDMEDIIMHDHLVALIGYGFGSVIFIDKPLIYYRSHPESVTSKVKITIYSRARNFVYKVFDKNYLQSYIKQIESFYYVYGNELNTSKLNLVKKFISLKKRNSVYRFIFNKFY